MISIIWEFDSSYSFGSSMLRWFFETSVVSKSREKRFRLSSLKLCCGNQSLFKFAAFSGNVVVFLDFEIQILDNDMHDSTALW